MKVTNHVKATNKVLRIVSYNLKVMATNLSDEIQAHADRVAGRITPTSALAAEPYAHGITDEFNSAVDKANAFTHLGAVMATPLLQAEIERMRPLVRTMANGGDPRGTMTKMIAKMLSAIGKLFGIQSTFMKVMYSDSVFSDVRSLHASVNRSLNSQAANVGLDADLVLSTIEKTTATSTLSSAEQEKVNDALKALTKESRSDPTQAGENFIDSIARIDKSFAVKVTTSVEVSDILGKVKVAKNAVSSLNKQDEQSVELRTQLSGLTEERIKALISSGKGKELSIAIQSVADKAKTNSLSALAPEVVDFLDQNAAVSGTQVIKVAPGSQTSGARRPGDDYSVRNSPSVEPINEPIADAMDE